MLHKASGPRVNYIAGYLTSKLQRTVQSQEARGNKRTSNVGQANGSVPATREHGKDNLRFPV